MLSLSTVRQWEIGEKQPSGPSLKLLALLDRKGMEGLVIWRSKTKSTFIDIPARAGIQFVGGAECASLPPYLNLLRINNGLLKPFGG